MRTVDLAVVGGTVVTMDAERRLIPGGVVLVDGDRVALVGSRDDAGAFAAARTIEAAGQLVLPGLVDAHGHAGHALVRNVGDIPGGNWLKTAEHIYFQCSTDDFWYASGLLTALERLRFGVTCGYSMVGNIPRADDVRWSLAHARGVREVGVRDVLGVGPGLPPWPKEVTLWDDATPTRRAYHADTALEVTAELCRMHRDGQLGSGIYLNVSPSRIGDPAGLGDDELRRQSEAVVKLAGDYGLVLNAHAYAGNIQYAYDHLEGVLGPRTVLAHCTGISAREVEILAATETSVAHCPSARSMVRAWCPAVDLMRAGVNVAIATDGAGPDRSLCVWKEMRTAAIIHRIHEQDDGVMPPARLLESVTIGAARALGLDGQLGSLEPGKLADIVLMDLDQPHLTPGHMPVEQTLYFGTGHDVSTVIVGGKVLMDRGTVAAPEVSGVLRMARQELAAALGRSQLPAEVTRPRELQL